MIAILFGLILLLPGACSLVAMMYAAPAMFSGRGDPAGGFLVILWLICFAISFGGLLMIRYGARK